MVTAVLIICVVLVLGMYLDIKLREKKSWNDVDIVIHDLYDAVNRAEQDADAKKRPHIYNNRKQD